jgi:hypothetical protein
VQQKAQLFDHLVGAGEQRWWNGEAEPFGGLKIDDESMRRYLLNWDVSGLRSLEYLVSLMGHLGDEAINVGDIGQGSPASTHSL